MSTCERDRDRERQRERERKRERVCVCVCEADVCVRQKERERESERAYLQVLDSWAIMPKIQSTRKKTYPLRKHTVHSRRKALKGSSKNQCRT